MNSFHSPLKTHQAILFYYSANVLNEPREDIWEENSHLDTVWSRCESQHLLCGVKVSLHKKKTKTCWDMTSILQTTSSPPHFVLAASLFHQKPAAKQWGTLVSESELKKYTIRMVFFSFFSLWEKMVLAWSNSESSNLQPNGIDLGRSHLFAPCDVFFHRRTDSCLSITYLNHHQ